MPNVVASMVAAMSSTRFAHPRLGNAEVVVLGDISVLLADGGHCHADARAHHSRRLVCRGLGQHNVYDLAGLQPHQAARFRNHLAVRREDARHPNQIEDFDAGIAKRQLETLQAGAMFARTLGEKGLSRHQRFIHSSFPPRAEKMKATGWAGHGIDCAA